MQARPAFSILGQKTVRIPTPSQNIMSATNRVRGREAKFRRQACHVGQGLRTLRPCDRRARQRDRIPVRAHAGRGPVTASLANPGAPAGERIELNFGGGPGRESGRERAPRPSLRGTASGCRTGSRGEGNWRMYRSVATRGWLGGGAAIEQDCRHQACYNPAACSAARRPSLKGRSTCYGARQLEADHEAEMGSVDAQPHHKRLKAGHKARAQGHKPRRRQGPQNGTAGATPPAEKATASASSRKAAASGSLQAL